MDEIRTFEKGENMRYTFSLIDSADEGRVFFKSRKAAAGKHPIALLFQLDAEECEELAAMFTRATLQLKMVRRRETVAVRMTDDTSPEDCRGEDADSSLEAEMARDAVREVE